MHPEYEKTQSDEQGYDSADRPDIRFRCCNIADFRFVRPVVCVAKVIAGPGGGCDPRRPEEESAQLFPLLLRRDLSGQESIVFIAVTKCMFPEFSVILQRSRLCVVQLQNVFSRVIAVRLHISARPDVDKVLFFGCQLFIVPPVCRK